MIVGSIAHFGQASGHYWTPSSPSRLHSIPGLMEKQRSSIWWSCTYYVCITLSSHEHGMRSLPMCNTTTTKLSIARQAVAPFKGVWEFNHCAWLMFSLLMPLHRHNPHMYSQRLIKQLGLFKTFNTSANSFTTSWINPVASISNDMINIGCHMSFRWVIWFHLLKERLSGGH